MTKQILGVVAGVITAFAVIFLVESLGHVIFPPPAEINTSDPESLKQYLNNAPVGALLMVLLAWLSGILAGVWVAGILTKANPTRNALIIGGLVLAGTIANLTMIPHPTWFSILSVLAILLVIYFSTRFVTKTSIG